MKRFGSFLVLLALLPWTESAAAGCVTCDQLLAADCNFGLWRIDPVTRVSNLVGATPDILFDLAVTPEGRLFGVDSSERLWELDSCTASGIVLHGGYPGFGMAGDLCSNDVFAAGPPLTRTPTSGAFPTSIVGGAFGAGPPFW